jgi:RNA polymerase sigma-70 factor (ECF subfamily)
MERYYRPLAEFVMSYVASSDAADDILQELFIKLWDRRETLIPTGSVRSYLYTAVRNAALNAEASSRARGRAEAGAADLAEETIPGGDREFDATELTTACAQAVDRLPPRCRDVFLLARDHNLSYAEIANTLGVAPSTVRNQMAKALSIVERRLAPFLALLLVTHL